MDNEHSRSTDGGVCRHMLECGEHDLRRED